MKISVGEPENTLINVIALEELLRQLSPIDRQLVLDYYVLDYNAVEMGRRYETNPRKISKRIKRIVNKLQLSIRK